MHGFRIEQPGGSDVLKWQEIDLPDPGPGQIQVKHQTCGVNYIDVYHRSGLYPLPLPTGIGLEACGTVVSVGEGVTSVGVGDRVAYGTGPWALIAKGRMWAPTGSSKCLMPFPMT